MKFEKKSQIAIFIILAILLLLLLIFLISKSNQDKIEDIPENIVQNSGDISYVKTIVDECLSRELKKATIISGLRGGFIYDNGEFYFPGTIPDDTYSPKLISNFGLNWNYLQSKVLVHSQAAVFQPGIKSNAVFNDDLFFEHSIEEDMQRYVLLGFMKCLDFSDYENRGFKLNYSDYLGKISKFEVNSNILEVVGMDAQKDDVVEIFIEGKSIFGNVTSIDEDKIVLKFSDLSGLSFLDAQSVKSLDVVNINRKPNLSITINENNIVSELFYLVSIENNGGVVGTFSNSNVELKVRYGGLLEISKVLLNYKYGVKKDVNYLEEGVLMEVLGDNLKGSEYFKYLKTKDFELKKKVIKDDVDHKQYIYSLIDKNSRILNEPFVLNFGYENMAPEIDIDLLTNDFVLDRDEDVIYLFTNTGQEVNYDLRNFSFEHQYKDFYTFYFEEWSYDGVDSKFELTKEGNLSFTPYEDKVYTYNIELTDGEASQEYHLYFVAGLPDNTDNKMAANCLKFKNFGDLQGRFPLSSIFNNEYSYEDEGKSQVFAYQIVPGVDIPKSELYFSKACIFNPDMFNVKVSFFNDGTQIGSTYQFYFDTLTTSSYSKPILIPQRTGKIDVVVEVFESGKDVLQTEPFVMSVYSASCLGPFPDFGKIEDFGGDLTCCNLNDIVDMSTKTVKIPPKVAFSNVYSSEHKALDVELYFTADVENQDFSNEIIWDVGGPIITSLFSSDVVIRCGGVYPNLVYNENYFNKGAVGLGRIENVIFLGEDVNELDGNAVKMNLVSLAEICEFGYFNNNFPLFIELDNGIVLKSGVVSLNSGAGTFPLNSDNNKYILCDNDFYKSSDGTNDVGVWNKLGAGNFVSKGYCYQGAAVCSGRPGSPTFG